MKKVWSNIIEARYKLALHCLFLLLFGIKVVAAGAETWQLVPGEGLGPIKVGMNAQELCRALPPKEIEGSQINPFLLIYDEGLVVKCEGGVVDIIIVTELSNTVNGTPVTIGLPPGVQFGQSARDLVGKLGSNYISSPLKVAKSQTPETVYAYLQYGFGFRERGGKVVDVNVFKGR